jgi:hypothetical protein
MSDTRKITTRLQPSVDRRLRATAALQRARISRVLNEALDSALPTLADIGAMVTETEASARREPADGDRA